MDLKKRIFIASAELFAQYTYSRVSIRDIAKKVGIQSSSIYYHYKSKEEILDELLRHYVRRTDEFHAASVKLFSQPDYVPRLDDIVFVYHREEVNLMFWITRILMIEQFTSPVAADALIGESHQRYTLAIVRFFEALASRGILHNPEKIPIYADMFMRMGHTFQLDFVHPEFKPQMKDLREMYVFILEMILRAEGELDYLPELLG